MHCQLAMVSHILTEYWFPRQPLENHREAENLFLDQFGFCHSQRNGRPVKHVSYAINSK
jgi:hypothetical protein